MARSLESYRAKLKDINLADGVSKEEAIIIAQNYLIDGSAYKGVALSRPSVGDMSPPIDGLGHPLAPCWEVSFNTTWKVRLESGLMWYIVDIDKRTGQIKVAGWGPS